MKTIDIIEKFKTHYKDNQGILKFEDVILNQFNIIHKNNSVLIICVGSDRSTGDCLAPLVGTFLEKSDMFNSDIYLYGTLHNPIHASNLVEKMADIYNKHPTSYIIAIDACLGKLGNIGNINFSNSPLKAGAGVGKKLPFVGDCHISANVNVGGFMEYQVLQNTKLSFVYDLSEIIANIIKSAYKINKE